VAADLTLRMTPLANVAACIDPLLRKPLYLSAGAGDLVQFLRTGLLDQRTLPAVSCSHASVSLPSGIAPLKFESCP
jgi:hypothetical protein